MFNQGKPNSVYANYEIRRKNFKKGCWYREL